MPNTIRVRSDRLEQLVGTDVYATSVSDIQTRAIPVTRTFTSLPVGPLTGSENVGEYCLVGSVTASVDAGLYVVRLSGADKVLERVTSCSGHAHVGTDEKTEGGCKTSLRGVRGGGGRFSLT